MINLLICLLLLQLPDTDYYAGIVRNREGNILENVHVRIKDTNIYTITNSEGKYYLPIDKPILSDSILQFSIIGYEMQEVRGLKNTEQKIFLEAKINELDAIIINAERFGYITNYSAQSVKFKSLEVYTSPIAFGDILAVTKVIPGSQSPGNDGKLYIRGGDSNESKIFVDEMLVSNPYQLSQKNVSTRSRFSPNLYQGISLQSGGYGSDYGQALSGIINMNTIDKITNNYINMNLNSTGLGGGTAFKTSNSNQFFDFNYINMKPYGSIIKDDYYWTHYYQNLQLNYLGDYKISNKLKMKVLLSGSKSSVDYSFINVDDLTFRNDLKENYLWGQATARYTITKRFELFVGSNLSYNNFKGTDVVQKYDSVKTIDVANYNKLYLLYKNNNFFYKVGIEHLYTSFNQNYNAPENEYKPDFHNNLISNFHSFDFFPFEDMTITVGGRIEYSTLIRKANIAPRFYAAYKDNNNIYSTSIGRYYQVPENDYLKINHKLDYASSDNVTLSYSYAKNNGKFQLDLYYKKYNKLIAYDTDNILYQANIRNKGNGYAYDADVFWKGNIRLFEYWLAYSYINSKRNYLNYNSKRIPDLLSKHSFKCDLKYWVPPIKTMIGLGYFIDSGSYNNLISNNEMITKKTPSRNSLTLSLSYLPKENLIIHFAVQNIFGKRNIYSYGQSYISGEYYPNTTPGKHFFYLGVYYTISKNKKKNEINNL